MAQRLAFCRLTRKQAVTKLLAMSSMLAMGHLLFSFWPPLPLTTNGCVIEDLAAKVRWDNRNSPRYARPGSLPSRRSPSTITDGEASHWLVSSAD